MSADLWAEFGQTSGSVQSSAKSNHTVLPAPNSLIDEVSRSDDIAFGDPSVQLNGQLQAQQQDFPVVSHLQQNPSAAPRQTAASCAFHLPQPQDSDVLFDATEDTPSNDSEDDEWGEFEGPEAYATYQNQSQHSTIKSLNGNIPPAAPAPVDKASNDSRLTGAVDLLGGLAIAESKSFSSQPSRHLINHPPTQPKCDDDSFGDWGDFTDAHSANHASPNAQLKAAPGDRSENSLMDDDFGDWGGLHNGTFTKGPSNPSPMKQPPTKATTPSKPGVSTKASSSRRQDTQIQPLSFSRPQVQQTPWEEDAFDDWADFEDGPAPSQPRPATSKPSTLSPTSKTTLSSQHFKSTPTSTPAVRPTNIPPPSILLDYLLSHLHTLAKEAQTTQPLSQPQKKQTATKIYNTLHTSARIIAGRTLRWKRDTILAQSMRIGPARAGKPGGMKLSAVNKHEDVKEEQDAVDVIALWRERASLFNAIIQAVGQKPIPIVPGPAALKVVTARAEQGGIKASHACALCALKRDERIVRVDEDNVQDSFGEWWTEHWGHTTCRVFWEENRGLLMQR